MQQTTPYDADRAAYPRRALARLVLSDHAAGVSATADSLAVTRFDVYSGPGGRVSEAQALACLAQEVLSDAVIYERERGTSWEDIGRYLGIDAAAAKERFTPALDRWTDAFETPYALDETGRKRVVRLPSAAYDPADACRRLDLRAHLRLGLRQDDRAVSGALLAESAADGVPDPEVHEMSGRILRGNLGPFLDLLEEYVLFHDFDEPDRDTTAWGLDDTDDATPGRWYTRRLDGSLHALDVHLARTADGRELSVRVAGAVSAELRLRIDTLFSAFAAQDDAHRIASAPDGGR